MSDQARPEISPTLVHAVEKDLQGYFSPMALFRDVGGAECSVLEITEHLSVTVDRYRVSSFQVWDSYEQWKTHGKEHEAENLRRVLDPEWQTYQQLRQKFYG